MKPVPATAARTWDFVKEGLNAAGAGFWCASWRIQAAWRASTGWIEIAALKTAWDLMNGAWPW